MDIRKDIRSDYKIFGSAILGESIILFMMIGGVTMKSVLLGNGVNIQFGGKAYSNDFILKRIIYNARANRYDVLFDGQISGKEIEKIFRGFVDIANSVLKGEYNFISNLDDREAIEDFKSRYTHPIEKYFEIMLEDWFLLIRLFFITNDDIEKQWRSSKLGFERMILDAIYNEGMLSNIHMKMNKKVKRFFADFDHIFSLNYDCNIELLTKRDIYHLHGNYSVIADNENPRTVKGYINKNSGVSNIVEGFQHCFCNALLDYSGELKFRRAEDIMKKASELEKWVELSKSDAAEYSKQINLLKENDENAYHCINTFITVPSLRYGTDYHFDTLSNLEGELHIIGLSPKNDSHIFRCINESKLNKVWFYYYSETDKALPIEKPYELVRVGDLWKSLGAEKRSYKCSYPIPNNPDLDKFIEIFNAMSFDPIPKARIIDEVNKIPQFEADRLCEIVREELLVQKKQGNAKSEDEMARYLNDISRIGLREGVLPSVLFMIYIINFKRS